MLIRVLFAVLRVFGPCGRTGSAEHATPPEVADRWHRCLKTTPPPTTPKCRRQVRNDLFVRIPRVMLRAEFGWLQGRDELHSSSGNPQRPLSRVVISDVERGKKEPCLRSVEILAIAFEMTVPQLFRSV
jgi:hypothetical protein